MLFLSQDNQVPVCPLCNNPIPVKKGEMPDVVVGQHIDRDCQSDPARNRRKVRDLVLRCQVKELVLCWPRKVWNMTKKNERHNTQFTHWGERPKTLLIEKSERLSSLLAQKSTQKCVFNVITKKARLSNYIHSYIYRKC